MGKRLPDFPAVTWAEATAPDLEALEVLACEAFARLPAAFRALCEDLVIRVEDFPDDEVIEDMGLESPFEILGLFHGVGLAQAGDQSQTGDLPNMILLYRRPILDYWAEHEETLGALVTHVLVHEIGHHFGLSDEDMEVIENAG